MSAIKLLRDVMEQAGEHIPYGLRADIDALLKIGEEPISLPFIVQYRRKDDGTTWHPMAAFDFQHPAENYAKSCTGENMPWEYRVIDISLPPLPEDK